jgi:hypothetical protein
LCEQADVATISQSKRRSTVRERIAYHEAKAREEEERKRKAADRA